VSVYYLDTSALVKRYVEEPGSDRVRSICDPSSGPVLVASHLAIAEMISALTRQVREGALVTPDYVRLRDAFRHDCLHQYAILPVSEDIVDHACRMLEQHTLRALDAIHLATALAAHRSFTTGGLPDLAFVAADTRLLQAAAAEGLEVENPSLNE
jgi:predicted nucleic acid-binding protein